MPPNGSLSSKKEKKGVKLHHEKVKILPQRAIEQT